MLIAAVTPATGSPGIKLHPSVPNAPEHFIVSINPDPDAMNHYIVKTTQGEWSFHKYEVIAFPRRDKYGTSVDWTAEERVPQAWELRVGDTVGPGKASRFLQRLLDSAGVDSEEELAEGSPGRMMLDDQRRKESLRVVRITPYLNTIYWEVVCRPVHPLADQRERRYKVFRSQEFSPMEHVPPVDESRQKHNVISDLIRFHGPYIDRDTGRVNYFAVHPVGRGRWPSWIGLPQYGGFNDGQLHLVRPPRPYSIISEQYNFKPALVTPPEDTPDALKMLQRGVRHPHDPLRDL